MHVPDAIFWIPMLFVISCYFTFLIGNRAFAFHEILVWIAPTSISQERVFLKLSVCGRLCEKYLESDWKPYHGLIQAMWLKIGRRNWLETVDSFTSTKTHFIVTERLRVLALSRQLITLDNVRSCRNAYHSCIINHRWSLWVFN